MGRDDIKTEKAKKKRGILTSSYLWAFIFAAAIAAWMASGHLVVGGKSDESAALTVEVQDAATAGKENGKTEDGKLFRVRAQTFHAQPREAKLTLRGRTEADARVEVRAETAGVVQAIPVKKGELVDEGTVLCRIEEGARKATLLEAKAALAQAEADFDATNRLARSGHTAGLKVTEMQAKLDAARAGITRAELDLARTNIKAPFRGIVEEQSAKAGDYLSIGGTCAHLVATDPLIIVGAVSERDVMQVRPGMTARADLITGQSVEGKIRFISAASDATTRTFRLEIEVPNPDFQLKDGVTADIRIPLHSAPAHQFTPAVLALDDSGQVGVRVVDKGDKVKFMPVTILGEDKNGIWVAGLPDDVTVITVGQDYVVDGQKVIVVRENPATSS